MASPRVFVPLSFVLLALVIVHSHPNCLNNLSPTQIGPVNSVCNEYANSTTCCSPAQFSQVSAHLRNLSLENTTCYDYVRRIICSVCDPYAGHLYDLEGKTASPPPFASFLDTPRFPLVNSFFLNNARSACDSAPRSPWLDAFLTTPIGTSGLYTVPLNLSTGVGRGADKLEKLFVNSTLFSVVDIAVDPLESVPDAFYLVFSTGIVLRTEDRQTLLPFLDALPTSYPYGNNVYSAVFSPASFQDRALFTFEVDTRLNGTQWLQESDGFSRLMRYPLYYDPSPRVVRSEGVEIISFFLPELPSHVGGFLAFNPDRAKPYLLFSTGDNSAWADRRQHAQNPNVYHGKTLRIDVRQPSVVNGTLRPYTIPVDNPTYFKDANGTSMASVLPEIIEIGLRNPNSGACDPLPPHTCLTGDVGENRFEMIRRVRVGANHGWNRIEGRECLYVHFDRCNTSAFEEPYYVYPHVGLSNASDPNNPYNVTGNTVILGYFYYGAGLPEVFNTVLFGDYVSGHLYSFDVASRVARPFIVDVGSVVSVKSDARGEPLLVILDVDNGWVSDVFRVKPTYVPPPPETSSARRSAYWFGW